MMLALIRQWVMPRQRSVCSQPITAASHRVWTWFALVLWGTIPATHTLASDWRVLPAELNLSADYPGRLVILERQAGDVWIDRTHASLPNIQFEHPGWLRVAAGCVVTVERDACPDDSRTAMTLNLGGAPHRIPVRILSSQSAPPIFPREVAAVLGKAGCNLGTCHGNLHGKAGFRLSLRGDDPLMDFTSIVRGNAARRIDMLAPEQSLLIRKPLGTVAHQGGTRFDAGSAESEILRRWIAEGCRWNAQSGAPCPTLDEPSRADETVVNLQVVPQRLLAAKASRTQQLVVQAVFGDGTRRDVTAWARYEPSVVSGVEISPTGLVSAAQPVDVSVSISYLNGRAASRLTFLPHDATSNHVAATDSRVDQLIEDQLGRYQVQAQPLADDYVFVRRATITIAGRLPTAAEVRRFTDDPEPDKHQRLIEALLMDPAYAMTWAMRWSDLLRNEQKVMSQKGAENWHAWLAEQIATDRPLSEMVSEMLTTTGSTYEHPAASFHRTHRDPETAAESIGQVFLGVRLQCARCHNHPFDAWRQDDYYGLAAYFTTIERKQLDNAPKDKFDKHIISGDEVISLAKRQAEIWHPGRANNVSPKPLTHSETKAEVESSAHAQGTPLEQLATWLTVDNRLFARNMANRIWYHYMGVGIVDPPDDFRDSNPPSHPELLEYLTDELVRSNYSTRHVSRLILVSQAFRRASIGEATLEQPLGGPRSFAGYPIRRMPAEVLYDAVSDVTGMMSPTEGAGKSTVEHRAMARVEVPTKSGFMTTFGKPGRLLVCECERTSEVSLGQSLVLVNGTETREKLASQKNYLSRLLEEPTSMESKLEELYLTALARPPRAEETQRLMTYIASAPSSREALEDILWALLNSKEFPLIR